MQLFYIWRQRRIMDIVLVATVLISSISVSAKDVPAKRVRVAPVEHAPVVSQVSTFGTLSPNTEDLSFKVGGRIARFLVEEGQQVEAGTLLAQLESDDAQDALDEQRVLLNQARRSYARIQQLFEKGYVQKSQLEDASDKLEQVRIAYGKARLNLQRCSLWAPSAGLILKEYQESLTTVAAGTSIFSFQSDSEAWVIKVKLTDRNTFLLKEGARAKVRFAAYPGEDLSSELTQLARVANLDDGLFTASVTIEPSELALRPGMVGEVDIYHQSERHFAQFPLAALVEVRGVKGKAYFLREDNQSVEKLAVTIYTVFGDKVAITEDLPRFEYVVTGGQASLQHGSNVIVAERVQ